MKNILRRIKELSYSFQEATPFIPRKGLSGAFVRAAQMVYLPRFFKFTNYQDRENVSVTFAYDLIYSTAFQTAVIWGGAALLYPSVEDELIKQGMKPKHVKQITPKHFVWVMPPPQEYGLLDSLYSEHQLFGFYNRPLRWVFGVKTATHSFGHYTRPGNFTPAIITTAPKKENFIADLERILFSVRPDSIDTKTPPLSIMDAKILPISIEDMRFFIFVHEVGHANHPENLSKREGEKFSDKFSVKWAKKMGRGEEIERFSVYLRSSVSGYISYPGDDQHDNALYRDSQINGTPVPSLTDVINSRRELAKVFHEYYDIEVSQYLDKKDSIVREMLSIDEEIEDIVTKAQNENRAISKEEEEKIDSLQGEMLDIREKYKKSNVNALVTYSIVVVNSILQKEGNRLSEFARRRAELYLEGVAYFMPQLFHDTLGYLPSKIDALYKERGHDFSKFNPDNTTGSRPAPR